MPLKETVHPGEVIKHDCLNTLNLTVTDAAKVLGVSRPTLSSLINGKAGVSPEMAIRLSKAFGSAPEFWLRLQMQYDLAQITAKADQIRVERYQPQSNDKFMQATPA